MATRTKKATGTTVKDVAVRGQGGTALVPYHRGEIAFCSIQPYQAATLEKDPNAPAVPAFAAKWAVVGFTKSLAIEAGPDGVRVNCLQPGNVEGERINRVIDAKAKALDIPFEAQKQKLLDTVSLRTFVTAEDIANMALFLATDAGKHISGQALSICGDIARTV